MIQCLNCGNKDLLIRLTTAIFIPSTAEGAPNFDKVLDRDLGVQARSNANVKEKILFCAKCSTYFTMRDLLSPQLRSNRERIFRQD